MTLNIGVIVPRPHPRAQRARIGVIITAAITVAMIIVLLIPGLDRLLIGAFTVLIMLGLMLLRVPIGVAMTLPAFLGLFLLVGPRGLAGTLQDMVWSTFASWSFSVIPMFVLMGIAMSKSGLMGHAFNTARHWLGWLPGGLAISTNFAGAGLAATSGSSIGIAYTLGRVAIPEMIRERYSPRLAAGSVAAAGSLGQLIPPSILLVIYAGVAQTSTGQQLIAGIIPGLILATFFTIVVVIWALFGKNAAPRDNRHYTWLERFASLPGLLPILVVAIIVLGGIYFGVFTATEAGAFGALATLALGTGAILLRRRQDRRLAAGAADAPRRRGAGRELADFYGGTALETIGAVAAILFLIVGVMILTRVMALSGLAQAFADAVIDMGLERVGFLLLLIPVYLFLGIFLESLPMMLLTVPLLIEPLEALDIDLIWFGIFFIIIAEIDIIAPPLGLLNFIVLSIAKSSTKGMGVNMTIGDVYRGVLPFIGACLVFIVLLILFPEIATWLPEVSLGG
ncbi:TRAP transporter large permease [Microbacterium sp. NPDC055357]